MSIISIFDYIEQKIQGPTILIPKFNAIFKTEPVTIRVFVKEFMGRTLSEPQITLLEAIVGTDPTRLSIDYQMILAAVGQGGGKNYTFETLVSYYSYFITNLVNPFVTLAGFTGNEPLDRTRNIDIGNSTTVNSDQAERAFFENVRNAITSVLDPKTKDNWFERYAGLRIDQTFSDSQIEYYDKHSKRAIKNKIIQFPPLRRGEGCLRLISFDSTATSPEGYSFILAIIDELSRAETKKTMAKAKKLIGMYEGNNASRFGRLGKTLIFSYLNTSQYDYTHQLLKIYEDQQKQGIKTGLYAVRYATWVFNPRRTQAEFADKQAKDPVDYSARYMCIKTGGVNQLFYPYTDKIATMFNKELIPAVAYSATTKSRPDQLGNIATYSAVNLDQIIPDNRPRAFAMDPSINGDGFTIVGGYSEAMNPFKSEIFRSGYKGNSELVVFNRRPRIDVIIRWKPDKDHPVDFLNVEHVIEELLKNFPNTYAIHSDRYQSEKFRQEIEAKGVSSKSLQFSRTEQERFYKRLRLSVWNSLIDCIPDPILENELNELILDGSKVDHPEGGSKDISDGLVISADLLVEYDSFITDTTIKMNNDAGFREIVNRFIEVRHYLRQEGVNDFNPLQIVKITERMDISMKDAMTLKKHIEDTYPRS